MGTTSLQYAAVQLNGARRYSIAEYVAKHARGRFKLLIADEAHEFKSKSSDRGVAFHQLVTAAKQTLTLTGTFFGGKSTSIFWLLHRLNAGVRRDFAFHDENGGRGWRSARIHRGAGAMMTRMKMACIRETGATATRRRNNRA